MELNYKQGKSYLASMRSNPQALERSAKSLPGSWNEKTDDDIFPPRALCRLRTGCRQLFRPLPCTGECKGSIRPNSLARARGTRLAASSIQSHPASFVIFRLRRISVAGVPLDCSPFHVGSNFRHLRTCPPRNDPISPLSSSSYSLQQNA
jgi:hypothetical protein